MKYIIIIDGPDADDALANLLSNVEFDKTDVAIWISDNPTADVVNRSTLAYIKTEGE